MEGTSCRVRDRGEKEKRRREIGETKDVKETSQSCTMYNDLVSFRVYEFLGGGGGGGSGEARKMGIMK